MTGAGAPVLDPPPEIPAPARPPAASAAAAAAPDGAWRGEWAAAYGRHWRLQLSVLGALVAAGAALASLGDPDLPLHMAVGQWIVAHRGVPYAEPFAWTRPGAPYYAYSWLPQLLFYGVAKAGGAVGLRLLQGVLSAAAGAAMLVLGRAARWSPRTSVVMAMVNLTVAGTLVSRLRPQMLLLTLVPLAWACVYSALRSPRPARPLAGLLLVSALAANSHLFFAMTAAPWALLADVRRRDLRRAALVVAATVGGWFVSPYGTSWPGVFRVNFGPNALTRLPSPIAEFWPGFLSPDSMTPIPFIVAIALALLPWVAPADESPRRRTLSAAAWLVGLVAFGCAVRLLLGWWMLVLPMAAAAVTRVGALVEPARTQPERLGRIFVVWLVCATFLLSRPPLSLGEWRQESPITGHRLPAPFHDRVEPLAAWLDCHRGNASGRMLTVFNFGSQLTWRLPRFSMSIDSRTIFPDSVARPEAFMDPSVNTPAMPPWRSAELAILPLRANVTRALDADSGWRRVAVAHTADGSAALWVTRAWWARTGADPLPSRAAVLLPTQAACR